MRSGGITGLHPTKQGYLYLSANTPHFWRDLCEALGVPELANDPRFDTIPKRAAEAATLVPIVRAALAAKTAVEWEALLADKVPCAAARPVADMFDNAQVLAMGHMADFAHAGGGYRGVANPVRVGHDARAPVAAPSLGEHSRIILDRYGYSAQEIDALFATKAVSQSPP